jgi:hypothetical protein
VREKRRFVLGQQSTSRQRGERFLAIVPCQGVVAKRLLD